ncbi:MAG: SdpI family protein [Clostridium sp.]
MGNLIIGITMCIIGVIMSKFYTKEPSGIGYKTPMAKKNNDTWIIAQKVSGKLTIVAGIINLGVEIILRYIDIEDKQVISFGTVICTLLLIVIFTEIYLGRMFKNDGSRRAEL